MSAAVVLPVHAEQSPWPRPGRAGNGARIQFFTELASTSRRGLEAGPLTVRWRLLAANHRCLGRSATGHPDLGSAQDHLAVVLAWLDRATTRCDWVCSGPVSRWSWSLVHDGEAAAVSPRGYQRRVECELALRQFLRLATQAEVLPDLAIFRAR